MDVPVSTTTSNISPFTKINAILRLSRWREHIPWALPLTLLGMLLASELNEGVTLDWQVITLSIANILTMSFAFMINDVEDAEDDARDPYKKQRNPISSGAISKAEGMLITWGAFIVAFLLYLPSGFWVILWGSLMLVLCYAYSTRRIRLKARPIVDIVSHVLMLGSFLIMTGYYAYDSSPSVAWLAIIGITLVSAYGQLYNQVDDYEVDTQAGLRNTVVLLGKRPTQILMYLALVTAIIFLLLLVLQDVFPRWIIILAPTLFLVCWLFPWKNDMRGGEKADFTGSLQIPSLIVFNFIAFVWIFTELGWVTISSTS